MQFGNNYIGDYALVSKTDSTANLTNQVLTSPTTVANITGTRDDLPVNTIFTRYGASSRQSTGWVTATNASVNYWISPQFYTIHGLTIGRLHPGYTSITGDSGGPYRVGNDFVGIHSGSDDSNEVYFTPYIRFKHVFSPKTW